MKKILALLVATTVCLTPVSAVGNLYINAEFDNEAVDYGVNKFTVFGENDTNESKTFRIINTVSENGKLIGMSEGGSVTVAPGSSFSKNSSVTVPETADIGNTKIDVYLWNGADGNTPISQEISSKSVKFKYTLEEDAKTSAAVYDKNGKLIKTLWSAQQSYEGDNFGVWDGTNDAGIPMASGNYEVKVLSHNVEYEMDSVIANNSTGDSQKTIMSNYNTISDMCLVGNKMYYAEQYTEGTSTCRYFDISNPNVVAGYRERNNTRINIRVASDGKYNYWMTVQPTPFGDAAFDETTTIYECFIYAIDPTTPGSTYMASTVEFPAGETRKDIWNVRSQFCAIGIVQYGNIGNAYNTGVYGYGDLAVQTNGNYLAAVYGSRDFIRIMNKTTGVILKDNAVTDPRALTFDKDGNLWAAFEENGSYVIKRFTVNSDGSLTANLTAPNSVNIERAISLELNPSETQLTVAYGGDTNKVISYNLSDWSMAWSYGSGESYKTDPAVYDDKLLFKQYSQYGCASDDEHSFYTYTFLEYEDDGNIWVGDPGNNRSLKLNVSGSAPTVSNSIYSPKQSYVMSADPNNSKRVFLDAFEYEIDYSKDGGNDAWKLKNNWSYEAENIDTNITYRMSAVTTLSNGRTYFTGIDKADGQQKIYELLDKSFRNTGIVVDGHVLADGSFAINKVVKEKYNGAVGQAIYRKYVTGFDSLNNPIYSEVTRVGFVPDSLSARLTNRTEITESGRIINLDVSKNATRTDENTAAMRLKAYDVNSESSDFIWQTSPETFRNYMYDFPRDGSFNIGGGTWNTVHYEPQVFGENVIFAYSGEGYKQKQAEIFYHYTDDGLLVGVYGTAAKDQNTYELYDEELYNGNGFHWNMVFPYGKDADTAYIYQGGEARLSGLVRFKVSGLSSMKTQSINISLGSNLRNGLLAEVFEGSEYLMTNATSKTVLDKVEFMAGGEGLADYGIRYSGYITKPLGVSGITKIWVYSDGNATIKINNAEKTSGTGLIGTAVSFKDDETYRFELVVKNSGGNITDVKMFYEGDGELKEYPMINLITENLGNENAIKTIDLLANLPQDATLAENGYGWNFGDMIANAGENELESTSYLSSVKTNYAKYDYKDNSDLDITMKLYQGRNTEVRRSLGDAMENINEWEISSEIMFLGKLSGWYTGTIPGEERRYIEILDENDKVIARVEAKNDYAIYGNDQKIYQAEVPQNYSEISMSYLHDFSMFNPLKIRCVDGNVTFEYKNGTVSTTLLDTSANWRKPATIRVFAFKNSKQDPYPDVYETIFGELLYTQRSATGTHMVTFYDEDRVTVLKRENVENGGSATAPNANKTGYILSWSTSFDNVTSNINVYAIYTPDQTVHTVSFYDENETFISSAQAVFGTAVVAPSVSKDGYKFLGWFTKSGNQVDLAAIAEDISVYAKYQRTGTFTETFDNFVIDYTNKTVSGNTFGLTATDNLFADNSYDGDKVMSVKEVEGKDGNITKALYINPYRSANGEVYSINLGEIRTGKVNISFDYKISEYALSTGFNYFGTLKESGSEQMAVCMAEIRSFGNSNPFATTTTGAIRRVDKVIDANGKYSSYTDISKDKNWHSLSYNIDMDEKSYTLIVDGTTIGTYSFYDDVSYIDSLYFTGLNYNAAQNMGRYYIDNIQVEYK